MRKSLLKTSAVFFILGLICESSALAKTGPTDAIDEAISNMPEVINEISEERAIEAADSFVKDRRWGHYTSVIRTGSRWFRVEYDKGPNGLKRFVLVEPSTGNVEDTLHR